MIALSLIALALWAVIATAETVARDGYRPMPFDPYYETRARSAAPARLL